MDRGEIEPYARGSVEPMKPGARTGDSAPVPFVPMPMNARYEAPDFVELFPPADTKFQEWWSKFVMPFRALALAFLWVTFAWWRFAIMIITIVLIILLIVNW